MHGKYVKYRPHPLIVVAVIALGFIVGRLSIAESRAASGTLDSSAPPGSTFSYTLEDIYNRLAAGADGAQSAFAEPASGPTAGTGHTLNQIMAVAPAADNVDGALPAEALIGKTYWSLRTDGTWGVQSGAMPNRGTVVYTPGTSNQAVAAGYHSGAGYVVGDTDLAAGNIKDGVVLFGVTGTYIGEPTYPAHVPKTGQTLCYNENGAVISCTGTGQDGEYQKGAAWPNPRFADNGNGTVTDNLTGLIWLKNAGCTIFFTGDGTGQNNRPWNNALTAANLLAHGRCGLTDGSNAGDWRLPNVQELHSLIDYSHTGPALPNDHPFTGILGDRYWSSTTRGTFPSSALGILVLSGGATWDTKTYWGACVWPVRGGQ